MLKSREADWTQEQPAVFEGLTHTADSRLPIERLSEGWTARYLGILSDTRKIARDSPNLDEYVNRFQDRFPRITVRLEARRRTPPLVKLGLTTSTPAPLGHDAGNP